MFKLLSKFNKIYVSHTRIGLLPQFALAKNGAKLQPFLELKN